MINPYWELVIFLVMINVIFTLSLNLILGYNGQFSLGHAGFLAIGAYGSGVATTALGLPLFAGVLMSIACCIVAAVIVGYPCLRLGGDYLAIATLGFAEIIRIVLLALPEKTFGGATGMQNIHNIYDYLPVPAGAHNGIINLIFTIVFSVVFLALTIWGVFALGNFLNGVLQKRFGGNFWRYIVWAGFVVLIIANLSGTKGTASVSAKPGIAGYVMDIFQFSNAMKQPSLESRQWLVFLIYGLIVLAVNQLIRNFLNSVPGRGVVAIRENEIAATNLGINVFWLKLQNFMLGCAFAGLAGALLAHTIPLIKPIEFGFLKSVDVLLMVVLGGMGSMTGSFVGAVSISVLPEVLRGVGEWRMVLYSLVLILFMLFKPGGIFGTNELSDIFRLPWLKRGKDAEASDA
ncbi:branched-chain amino acid ABC transporter permease [bacterium]|nr:branched-chain amino acid ABC transporter permease [bacterium]